MGLIKSGIKWGTIGYLGHQGIKAFDHQKQQTQPPQAAPPMYYPQQQQQTRDGSGYLHQTWCNGQCGYHCNDGNNAPRAFEANSAPRSLEANNVPHTGEAATYYGNEKTIQ